MQTVTRLIVEQGLKDRIIRVGQLRRLVGGSEARRYGLVNRALKSGELLQLQRGLYVLADRYRHKSCHPFALAQALVPGSYISFETALSYHGWIPEKVFTIASIVPGRKLRRYEKAGLDIYTFHPLALEKSYFLELVNRHRIDGQSMLVAKPCRALMDLVCLRKMSWPGMALFIESLRIEKDLIKNTNQEDISTLKLLYKHKRMKSFLSSFQKELYLD